MGCWSQWVWTCLFWLSMTSGAKRTCQRWAIFLYGLLRIRKLSASDIKIRSVKDLEEIFMTRCRMVNRISRCSCSACAITQNDQCLSLIAEMFSTAGKNHTCIYDFYPKASLVYDVIKVPMPWNNLLSLGLDYYIRNAQLAGMRIFVCPSIIVLGERTAGPKETGEAPFDAP